MRRRIKTAATKDDAIARFREIQSGDGVDRDTYLAEFGAGEVAESCWNKGMFTLGIEYGYLIALAEVFGITPDDLSKADGK